MGDFATRAPSLPQSSVDVVLNNDLLREQITSWLDLDDRLTSAKLNRTFAKDKYRPQLKKEIREIPNNYTMVLDDKNDDKNPKIFSLNNQETQFFDYDSARAVKLKNGKNFVLADNESIVLEDDQKIVLSTLNIGVGVHLTFKIYDADETRNQVMEDKENDLLINDALVKAPKLNEDCTYMCTDRCKSTHFDGHFVAFGDGHYDDEVNYYIHIKPTCSIDAENNLIPGVIVHPICIPLPTIGKEIDFSDFFRHEFRLEAFDLAVTSDNKFISTYSDNQKIYLFSYKKNDDIPCYNIKEIKKMPLQSLLYNYNNKWHFNGKFDLNTLDLSNLYLANRVEKIILTLVKKNQITVLLQYQITGYIGRVIGSSRHYKWLVRSFTFVNVI